MSLKINPCTVLGSSSKVGTGVSFANFSLRTAPDKVSFKELKKNNNKKNPWSNQPLNQVELSPHGRRGPGFHVSFLLFEQWGHTSISVVAGV